MTRGHKLMTLQLVISGTTLPMSHSFVVNIVYRATIAEIWLYNRHKKEFLEGFIVKWERRSRWVILHSEFLEANGISPSTTSECIRIHLTIYAKGLRVFFSVKIQYGKLYSTIQCSHNQLGWSEYNQRLSWKRRVKSWPELKVFISHFLLSSTLHQWSMVMGRRR